MTDFRSGLAAAPKDIRGTVRVRDSNINSLVRRGSLVANYNIMGLYG